MTIARRARCPWWFELAIAVAVAVAVRALDSVSLASGAPADQAPPIGLAFWALISLVAGAIWKGLEVAGRITLEVLKWSVLQLWSFARMVYNGSIALGKEVVRGLRKGWDFLQATYENVLRPAWEKLWKWYDRARKWLDDVVGPIYRFLVRVREEFLKYYDRWVRPILDSIDIARRWLRVFQGFGWDWARRLDDQFARIQERIDGPIRLVLSKINETINVVNRIATVNGLLQRVALVRSIERDIRQVQRAFANWRSDPVTPEAYAEHRERHGRTEADIWREFVDTVEPGGAARDPQASEIAANWRLAIERRGRF